MSENVKIDFQKRLINRVTKEFDAFRDDLISQPALNVFHRAYEIHIKTEVYEVLTDGADYFEDYEFMTLLSESQNLLDALYNYFVGSEYASVQNYGETASAIRDYLTYYKYNRMRFLGRENGTAYYYLDNGHYLSRETLAWIIEHSEKYVIAADALALSPEFLQKHNITFLKNGRDIELRFNETNEQMLERMKVAVATIEKKG